VISLSSLKPSTEKIKINNKVLDQNKIAKTKGTKIEKKSIMKAKTT